MFFNLTNEKRVIKNHAKLKKSKHEKNIPFYWQNSRGCELASTAFVITFFLQKFKKNAIIKRPFFLGKP